MKLRKQIYFQNILPPKLTQVGALFNKESFAGASLAANGYTKTGTGATWTASGGGTITSTSAATANIYDEAIRYTDYNYSALEDFTQIVVFSATSYDATSIAVLFGIFNINTYRNLYCSITLQSGSANGTLKIYENTTLRATGGTKLVCAAGDLLRARITRFKNNVTFTVSNLSNNTSGTNTVSVSFAYSITTQFPNSRGYFSIWNSGGNYTFYSHKALTNQMINVKTALIGDSISYGAGSTIIGNRFYTLLNIDPAISVNLAGGGDATAEVLLSMTELLAINSTYYLLMIGGNDIQFGVATATWKANYNSIVSQIKSAGHTVIHCTPTPRNAYDMTPLRDHINTVFAGDIIVDTYTALWSGSSFTMNATYNSGDGVHPNDAGHTLMASTILAAVPQIV